MSHFKVAQTSWRGQTPNGGRTEGLGSGSAGSERCPAADQRGVLLMWQPCAFPPFPHRHPTPTPLVCPFQFLSQLKQKRLTLTVFVLALYTSAGMTLSPFKRVQYFSL